MASQLGAKCLRAGVEFLVLSLPRCVTRHLPCKSSSGGDEGVTVSTQDPAAPHVRSEDLPSELRLSQFPKESISPLPLKTL